MVFFGVMIFRMKTMSSLPVLFDAIRRKKVFNQRMPVGQKTITRMRMKKNFSQEWSSSWAENLVAFTPVKTPFTEGSPP